MWLTFFILTLFLVCISAKWCHSTQGNTQRPGTIPAAYSSSVRYPYLYYAVPARGSYHILDSRAGVFMLYSWHTPRDLQRKKGARERERKVRDSVMHWVRGMPNYNHLWWYNHSSVKLHSRLIYPPLSYDCAALSFSDMSETGNLTLESQVSTSEESLSFQEFLFFRLIYERFPHFNLRLCMKSVPLGLPYTRRLMNPICKSDLLAAKALLLLSLLMPAFKKMLL